MIVSCDLHLHSRYSMATSPSLDLKTLADTAFKVGIDLLSAPDFTHPVWRTEMKSQCRETQPGSGIYEAYGSRFILVSEVSCIWKQAGSGRRVHLLVMAPSFDAVERLCVDLAKLQRLESDGRPALTVSAQELFHMARDADAACEIIPAHVFTPWYGIFGTKSGFESIEECFGDVAGEIFAVETGLSSDPEMHWAVPDSASRSIVSFSDAHSTRSIGRELTMLDVEDMSYTAVIDALRRRRVVETYEFHPEHGKYHLDGHRKCNIRMSPLESADTDGVCPVCSRPMTLGVLNRANKLASLPLIEAVRGDDGEMTHPEGLQPPFRRLIPLRELLSYSLGVGINTKSVERMYTILTTRIGSELNVLLESTLEEILSTCGRQDVAAAVMAARFGNVTVEPGYDGVYGSAVPNSPTGDSLSARLLL